MVNNFKPYDPNDDSERSSAESYLPSKPKAPKVDQSSQSFPSFPEELERDNFQAPVSPNPTQNQIIEESEKIQEEVDSIIQKKESPYIKTIGVDPEYEFTDPIFKEYEKGESEIREAVSSSEENIQAEFKKFQDWNQNFTGDYDSYESEYNSRLESFKKVEKDHNNLVGSYNSFIEGNFPLVQERENRYLAQLDLADRKLKRLESQWDSASQEVPFEITGVDYGSDLSKRPDWQVPTPSPDFSKSGRDNTDKIEDVVGDYLAINFGGSGVDYSNQLQKKESAIIKPLVFDDLKKDERFVEALGDRKSGSFSRIAPQYKKPQGSSPDQELIEGREFFKPEEKFELKNLNPFDPNIDPLTRAEATEEFIDKNAKAIKETVSEASKDYLKDVNSWVKKFSEDLTLWKSSSQEKTSIQAMGDLAPFDPVTATKGTRDLLFGEQIKSINDSWVYEKDSLSKSMQSTADILKDEKFSAESLKEVFNIPLGLANRLRTNVGLTAKGLAVGLTEKEKLYNFSGLFFESEDVIKSANKDWLNAFNKTFKNQKSLGIKSPTPYQSLNSVIHDVNQTWKHNRKFEEEYLQLGGDSPYAQAYYNLSPEEKKRVATKPYAIEDLLYQTGRGVFKRAWKPVDTITTATIIGGSVKGLAKMGINLSKSKAVSKILNDGINASKTIASSTGLSSVRNKIAPIKTGQYYMFDTKAQEVIGARVVSPRFSYGQVVEFAKNMDGIGVPIREKIYEAQTFLKNFKVLEIERQINPKLKALFKKDPEAFKKNMNSMKALPEGSFFRFKQSAEDIKLQEKFKETVKEFELRNAEEIKLMESFREAVSDQKNRSDKILSNLRKDPFFKLEEEVFDYLKKPTLARKKMTKTIEAILKDNEKLDRLVGKDIRRAIRLRDVTIDNLNYYSNNPLAPRITDPSKSLERFAVTKEAVLKRDVANFIEDKVLKIVNDPLIMKKFTKKDFNKLVETFQRDVWGSKAIPLSKYEKLFPLFEEMGKTTSSKSKEIIKAVEKKFVDLVTDKPQGSPVSYEDVSKAWNSEFKPQKKTAELISRIDEAIGGFKSPEKITKSAIEKKDPLIKTLDIDWKLVGSRNNPEIKTRVVIDDDEWLDFMRYVNRRAILDDNNKINYLGNTIERSSLEALYGEAIVDQLFKKRLLDKDNFQFAWDEKKLLEDFIRYTQKALPLAKSDKGLISGTKKAKGFRLDIPFPNTIGGLGSARINVNAPNFNNIKTIIGDKLPKTFTKPKPTRLVDEKSTIRKSIKASQDLPSPEDILKRYKNLDTSKLNSRLGGLATIDLQDQSLSNVLPIYEDKEAYKKAIAESKKIKTEIKVLEKPQKSTLTLPKIKTEVMTAKPKDKGSLKPSLKPLEISTTTETPERLRLKALDLEKMKAKASKPKTETLQKLKDKAKEKSKLKIKLDEAKSKSKSKDSAKLKSKAKVKDLAKSKTKVTIGTPKTTPKPDLVKTIKLDDGKKPKPKLVKPSGKSLTDLEKRKSSITKVGWKQGEVYPVVNLEKNLVSYFKKRPQGIKNGRTPRDTFSILERKPVSKSKTRRFSMGKFDVSINGDVSFSLKRKRVLPFERLEKLNKLRRK
tara:strand:+ start:3262 stop:8019 length:4758 start_codon:yes stop_codon:yes gene_type:complete